MYETTSFTIAVASVDKRANKNIREYLHLFKVKDKTDRVNLLLCAVTDGMPESKAPLYV